MRLQVEVRLVAAPLAPRRRQRRLAHSGLRRQADKPFFDLSIAIDDLPLVVPIAFQRLPQSEQMLVAIVPPERLGDRCLRGAHARVA